MKFTPPKGPAGALFAHLPAFCRVTGVIKPAVRFEVWLPMKDWNGRFEGTGGGGFSGGNANGVRQPLSIGYAAGATDTGHTGGSGSFVLAFRSRSANPLWLFASSPQPAAYFVPAVQLRPDHRGAVIVGRTR